MRTAEDNAHCVNLLLFQHSRDEHKTNAILHQRKNCSDFIEAFNLRYLIKNKPSIFI